MKMNLITRLTEAGAVLSIPSDGGPCPLHGIALDPIWGSLSWVPGATHMPLSVPQFPHLFPKTLPSLP